MKEKGNGRGTGGLRLVTGVKRDDGRKEKTEKRGSKRVDALQDNGSGKGKQNIVGGFE